jgi:DNA polymerase-3 subunit alpha
MEKYKVLFVDGCVKNGIDQAKAAELYDLIAKFAEYGFNKSHAAAYALVAYQTAYLKAHFPSEFMAANMSAVMDDTDKVRQFYDDALANGLKVELPNVNAGEYRFVPVDAQTIRYGLGAIKGTGESAINCVTRAREAGPFRDLFDFCERVDKRLVNRRVVEALVRAGAFDAVDPNRASLLASVGVALEAAEQRERDTHQVSLFGAAEEPTAARINLVAQRAWDERQRLKEEKLALGFYLSGHPYNAYREEIGQFVRSRLDRLAPASGGGDYNPATQMIAGIIESMRAQKTQSGRMMVINLSDGSATVEVTLYNEVFDQYRKFLVEDAVVVMDVKVRQIRRAGDDGDNVFTRISAERVYDLAGARARFGKLLRITCNGQSNGTRLRDLLAPYRPGACPVAIVYSNEGARCEVRLGEEWRVNLSDNLVDALADWVSRENVQIVYQ